MTAVAPAPGGPDPADVSAALSLPWTPAHVGALVEPPGTWAFPRWLQHLNDEVTRFLLTPGEGFLIVEVPVRHGKSLYCSVHVPTWFLGRFPDRRVLLATYSKSLSNDFARQVRTNLEQHGTRLFGHTVRRDSRAVDDWRIEQPHKGGMRAVPLGGTIIGTGGDLIIIDDPIKSPKDVDTKKARDELHTWYKRVVRNRLEPGGKIILVMARWNSDDLAGRLADVDEDDDYADEWKVIHLPALAEPTRAELHALAERQRVVVEDVGEDEDLADVVDLSSWTDTLGRTQGEPLWPERWPRSKLLQARSAIGPSPFAAQYQQAPTSAGGDMFPEEKWKDGPEPPAKLILVRHWDMGGESSTADWTAGALVGVAPDRTAWVLDVRRMRGSDDEKERFVERTAEEDAERWGGGKKGAVHIVLEQEPGSSGKTVAASYVSDVLMGYSAEAKPTTGSKEINARPMSAVVQAGNAYLLQRERDDGSYGPARWRVDFVEEAGQFPYGGNDDQIDAATKAYNRAVELWREKRKKRHKASARTAAGRQRKPPPGPGGRRRPNT